MYMFVCLFTVNSVTLHWLLTNKLIYCYFKVWGIFIWNYIRTSLVRTPGDRQNVFALSGIRINRCHLYWKGIEGD